MNSDKSFQDRARKGKEELSKQMPVTFEKACLQAQRLKTQSKSGTRKEKA
ncbi:hypothetical protein [Pleomorphovibrio marinus]|nr:hypothetical protein [Pleomorphovibrio marinus]